MRKLISLAPLLITGLLIFQSCKKNGGVQPANNLILSSFSPGMGAKGTTVVLTGAGFSSNVSQNQVTFNGVAATVLAASATNLKVSVPRGAGDGKITVKVGGGTVSTATDFIFNYTVTTLAGDSTGDFADGLGSAARFWFPRGVAADAAGNVYVADFFFGFIRKVSPGGQVTTLVGRLSTVHEFYNPCGIAVDAEGNVYVADTFNQQIKKIVTGGVSILAGGGGGNLGFADGQGTAARFNYPTGVAVDAAGNVYVADQENNRIRKITATGLVTTLAGGKAGFADGPTATALFNEPAGIAVDLSGNLYVADGGNHRVRRISKSGMVTTIAGSGIKGDKDGTAADAQFENPIGVATDKNANVYVTDPISQKIRRISPSGQVSTIAGGYYGFADGIGTDAMFYLPTSVAADAFGNIYISDSGNNRIRKLD